MEEAEKACEQILHFDKDQVLAYQVREEIAKGYLEKSQRCYKEGDYDGAQQYSDKALKYAVEESAQSLIKKNKASAKSMDYWTGIGKKIGRVTLEYWGLRAAHEACEAVSDLIKWGKKASKESWFNSSIQKTLTAGQEFLNEKQYEKALIKIREAKATLESCKKNKEIAIARFMSELEHCEISIYNIWGDNALENKNYVVAKNKYNQSIELASELGEDSSYYLIKSLTAESLELLEAKRYEDALEKLKQAYDMPFAKDKDDKDYRKIIEEEIIKFYDVVGTKALVKGDYDKACEKFEEGYDFIRKTQEVLDPLEEEARGLTKGELSYKVKLLCAQGCYFEGQEQYEKALECFDGILNSEYKLEENANLAQLVNEHIASSSYKLGHQLIVEGKVDKALMHFKKAEELFPKNLDYALKVSYLEGNLGFENNDSQEAAVKFLKVLEILAARKEFPNKELIFQTITCLDKYGDELAVQGNYDEAKTRYEQAYNLSRDDEHYKKLLSAEASYYHQRGKYGLASIALQKLLTFVEERDRTCKLSIVQSLLQVLEDYGDHLLQNQQYYDAQDEYFKAIHYSKKYKLDQYAKLNHGRLFAAEGGTLWQEGEYDLAQEKFEQVVECFENKCSVMELVADFYNDFGENLFTEGDYDGAKVKFHRASDLSEKPGLYAKKILIVEGYESLKSEDFKGALDKFKAADKSENEALDKLIIQDKIKVLDAWAGRLYMSGLYSEARELYKEVCQLSNDDLEYKIKYLFAKGYELLEASEINRAVESFDELIDIALKGFVKYDVEALVKVLEICGDHYFRQDQYSIAKKRFESASALADNMEEYQVKLLIAEACCLSQEDKLFESEKKLDQAYSLATKQCYKGLSQIILNQQYLLQVSKNQ